MSHVRRLPVSDRIFFVTVNLRRVLAPLTEGEYGRILPALEASRRQLHYLLLGRAGADSRFVRVCDSALA